jgi:hypothetical protein
MKRLLSLLRDYYLFFLSLFLFIFIVLVASFGNDKVLSSFVLGGNVYYSHFLLTEKNFSFSLLASTRRNVLLSLSYTNEDVKFHFGDNYVFFGNGLVLGNPRYRYFLNYLFAKKFVSNDIYTFDFYQSDRNFDGKDDISKGIYVSKNFNDLSVLPFLFLSSLGSFSNICAGFALNYGLLGGLLLVSDSLYFSLSVKEINFLGLGLVFSGEVAVSSKLSNLSELINLQLASGASFVFEWYINKFQFSLSANFLFRDFYSPYGSGFYSVSNKNGAMFSVIYSDGNKFKFYGVNKLLFYDGGTENEFSFSFIRRVMKNIFLNLRFSREQGHLFISLYPYFDNGFIEVYIEPQVAVNHDFYRESFFSYTAEGGIELNYKGLGVGTKVFVPISQDIEYFTFVSTTVRDSFGENEDIKISFDDTSFLVFARIMSKDLKEVSLPFEVNLEGVCLIKFLSPPSYRLVANFMF